MTDTQVDTHKAARFTPLRERAVTLVAPEDLTPPEPKPRPMTPWERAAWRRQVRAAFAVVEADPEWSHGGFGRRGGGPLTPAQRLFVVYLHGRSTGRDVLAECRSGMQEVAQ